MNQTLQRLFFEASYRLGFAEWSTGSPQPDLVRAVEEGAFPPGSRVLDLGCGAGESAVFLAERGHFVVGVDSVSAAIEKARERAAHVRGRTRFVAGDAFAAAALPEAPFDGVLDSGLLHQFHGQQVTAYVEVLRQALRPGGRLLVHAFSDARPVSGPGPRQLSEQALRAAFQDGFRLHWLRAADFHSTRHAPYSAWLALFERG